VGSNAKASDMLTGMGSAPLEGGGTGSRGSDLFSTLFRKGVKPSGRSDTSDEKGISSL
jgi:hypothetical protein